MTSRAGASRAHLRTGIRIAFALVLCALLTACPKDQADKDPIAPITVFAAASLKESLDAAAAEYQRETRIPVRVAYAASSTLARQIAQQAPVDVFISADQAWMDWLQTRQLIDVDSRRVLLGNTLVLVAPADSPAQALELDRDTDLLPMLGADGRISLALTGSVPAGKYARAAFESLDLWADLRPRAAESDSVRSALALVARGETPLGVVYGSDAKAEPRVRVLARFPGTSHPAIEYPVARVASSHNPDTAAFIDWLRGETAAEIFRRYGFATS